MIKLIESPIKNPYVDGQGQRQETLEERAIAIQIEHEHAPTLEKIKAYVAENDGKFPDIELVADWIHLDHKNEIEIYYNDKTGLPNMERELKKEMQQNL